MKIIVVKRPSLIRLPNKRVSLLKVTIIHAKKTTILNWIFAICVTIELTLPLSISDKKSCKKDNYFFTNLSKYKVTTVFSINIFYKIKFY
jgi:hypothetical protein